jgi:SAM-dependent methyltransferase
MADPGLRTAHEAWDAAWADADASRPWTTPEQWVCDVVPRLDRAGADRVLDLGCGIGRHSLLLAAAGFRVTALDASPTALASLRATATELSLELDLVQHDFLRLPFATETFGYALAWNVLYHGDGDTLRAALAEAHRVLAPDALFHVTFLSTANEGYGRGVEIRPDTFVVPDGGEKAHPHVYCTREAVAEALAAFALVQLRHRAQAHPEDWHWEALVRR